MCGRYRLSRRKQLVEEYFDTVPGEEEWAPRYNIAPTQPVPVIRQNPKEPRREMSLVRWGLVPSWAKDSSGAAMMINARSETAAAKPAFRDALKFRRCLVPVDGFYERQRLGKAKQDDQQMAYSFSKNCVTSWSSEEILRKRLIRRSPLLDVEPLKELSQRTPHIVTFEEEERILSVAVPYMRMLVVLILETGMRSHIEALSLSCGKPSTLPTILFEFANRKRAQGSEIFRCRPGARPSFCVGGSCSGQSSPGLYSPTCAFQPSH